MALSKSLTGWARNVMILLALLTFLPSAWSWGDSDRLKLDDVKVLTLNHGRMTTSRRSSPVPQLQCIGGTAGCGKYTPQVVQCINQGSDGYNVQWECKADMDNAYRFGRIEVVCEGYDHPGDKYVLRGSCGLEYTLDLTKEGLNRQNDHGHNYYGSDRGSTSYFDGYKSKSFGGGDAIVLIIIAIVIYAMYRTCIANNQWSNTNDDHPDPYHSGGTGDYRASAPPPPGFRPEYYADSGASCGAGQRPGSSSGGSGAGGFWTGAATGGLLGYMFGNRNTGYNSGYNTGYGGYRASPSWGNGSSGGGGWFGGGGGGGGSSGGSTGTRTASGFGGSRTR